MTQRRDDATALTTGSSPCPKRTSSGGGASAAALTREYPASVEGASRQGIYEEAASLGRSVSAAARPGSGDLPGAGRS